MPFKHVRHKFVLIIRYVCFANVLYEVNYISTYRKLSQLEKCQENVGYPERTVEQFFFVCANKAINNYIYKYIIINPLYTLTENNCSTVRSAYTFRNVFQLFR